MSKRIERHRLENGLEIVLHRDPSLPLVAVNLWYHVGSKNERPGRTGFAHLFEHMLFQGSANVGANDHFRYVQQAGGVANGSTWYDRTNYYETLPSHQLELGLWLESDRMGFLLEALTEEKLENQRSVVMNERRQRVDNQPYGRASERLNELLFPAEHPYHWPVIGYMPDIEAATLTEVCDFFRTYYAPNNAVLTLAGDLDPDAALALAERYFAPLPAGPEVARPDVGLPPSSPLRREVLSEEVQLPRVYMAFACPRFGSEEWYAGSILATLLADGKTSRLYQDLVYERQMAQSVSAYVLPTEACATFAIVAAGRPDTDAEALERVLSEHLARVAQAPPEAGEVERARKHQLTSHYSEMQTLDRRADLLSGFTTFFEEPELVWTQPERFGAVTPEDLQRFAERYGHPECGARVLVVPAQAS